MTRDRDRDSDPGGLGDWRAEALAEAARERLRRGEIGLSRQVDPSNPQALIEELRIHQIELEMQNDELSRVNGALHASRDWYFALFEASPTPLMLLGADLIVREANLAATDLLGWERHSLANQPFIKHVAPVDLARVTSELRYLLNRTPGSQSADRRKLEARVIGRAGRPDRERQVEMFICRFAADSPATLLIGMVDITEREAARQTIESARRTAERANDLKTRFVANISHELRAPLTSIIGYVDLVLTGADPDDAPRKLQIARRAADLLLATVNDLLDLSRAEADRLQLTVRAVSLRRIAEETVELFAPQCRLAGLELKYDCADDIPDAVLADEYRVRQILGNLIGNAIKYTREGHVRLEVAYRHGNGLLIVSDTGIGIPPDRQQQVFHPFEQVESDDSRQVGGAGLGLALCKRLAERMEGAIYLRSDTEGGGSTFTVHIPMRVVQRHSVAESPTGAAAEDPAESAAAPPSATPTSVEPPVEAPLTRVPRRENEERNPEGGKGWGIPGPLDHAPEPRADGLRVRARRILVVDDEPALAALLAHVLKLAGHTVVTASGGALALELLQGGEFDLVLLDMQMPGLDGFETARRMREMRQQSELPIVAVTASAVRGDMDRCLSAGCDGYLAKPIDIHTFASRVEAFLPD